MLREQLTLFEPFAATRHPRPSGDLTRLPRRSSKREAVLRVIARAGNKGVTDDEMLAKLLMGLFDLQRARIELIEGGFVQDACTRRKTAFGDEAIVWRLTDYGHKTWTESGRK